MSRIPKYNLSIQHIFCTFFLLLPFLVSCGQLNQHSTNSSVVSPEVILHDYMSFWQYWNDKVRLSPDYIAFDDHNRRIDRISFIKHLMSGHYMPLRMHSKDSLVYSLYPLNDTVNPSIPRTVSQYGRYFYKYYLMEGQPLPGFHFVDLKGNVYDPQQCRGKIVVLNCWFIACHACVAEMPELNELVKKYKDRKDILFVSLAWDSPQKVKAFLTKTRFDYAVVPGTEAYQRDSLHILMWPTQIIINRKGIISHVMNNYSDLVIALKQEAAY